MSDQGKLFALPPKPRKPSVTAKGTRERRAKARAHIVAKGLATWKAGDGSAHPWCSNCDANMCHEGAYVPRGRESLTAVCLDCVAYEGAPLRSWEHWATDAEAIDVPCIRCGVAGKGGLHARGGPFCFACDTPPREVHEAWLIALRTNPETPAPWAGDKVST